MKKPLLIMLVAVGAFFGAVFGWKAFVGMQIQKAMQAAGPPPTTVSAIVATAETWAPLIPAVGSLRAAQGVDVTPQEGGIITGLHFDSGDTVAAGDLLVQQYVADLEAELDGLIAARKLAEANLRRAEELRTKQLVSEFDYDSRVTELDRARAAEKDLRLRIAKKSVRAPFAGQLGIRKVDLGQYIEPGDLIARLENRTQMLVDFPVPQRQISNLDIGQPVTVEVDAWPGRKFPGEIRAIEPQVERDTRNLRLRAMVGNADGDLLPGMFAQIEILLPEQGDVVTVPQSAIAYSPYGDSVFLVETTTGADGETVSTVSNTLVVTGATRGDQVAILSGLRAGQMVVTSGQQKLRNGAAVTIDNTVQVSNNPDPSPDNT